MNDENERSVASDGSVDRPKPSAYLAMPSGYDFGVFMSMREAEDWLSGKDTNWKNITPLYAWDEWDEIRKAGDRVSREENHRVPMAEIAALNDEIDSLREAIRRLAEQDATLSVCGGAVTVTMDATLTDEEREAIERAAKWLAQLARDRGEIHSAGYFVDDAATLRGLLKRTK